MNTIQTRLTLLILSVLCFEFTTMAQNLVNNGSFEEYDSCYQTNWNLIDAASDWNLMGFNVGGSPDHFHSCNNTMPNTPWGYQLARTGVGMALVGTYVDGTEVREYFYGQLIEPLQIGKMYCITYYVVSANFWYRTNGLAINFSMSPHTLNDNGVLSAIEHIYIDSIVQDTLNWVKIQTEFVANQEYQFLTIGNFRDDLNTPRIQVQSSPPLNYVAGYYIDDISIYEIKPIVPLDTSIYACTDSVIIGDTDEDLAEYVWSPSIGLSDTTSFQVNALPNETTTYTLTKMTACDTSSQTFTVIVDSAYCAYRGGYEFFNLYPNPNNGTFTINYTLGHEDVNIFNIYDAVGKLVKSIKLEGAENLKQEISFPNLQSGLYIYRLMVNDKVELTKKMVVHR